MSRHSYKGKKKRNTKTKHKAKNVRHKDKKKSMFDILIYTCGACVIIGGLFISYLGVSGGFTSQRILALWILYLTLIFVVTGGFLYFYQHLLERQTTQPLSIADRPYVVVESASIQALTPNRPFRPDITIVNKGRTPAQKLTITIEVAAKAGYDYVLGFPDEGANVTTISFLAASDRTGLVAAPADAVTIDDTFFHDAMDGKEAFMIHGKFGYEDMTG